MSSNVIRIFDTTLRDGEQSPGCSMNAEEKLRMAHALARLGVDVIEAGFPASSQGDFDGVRRIAQEVRGPAICGLARATAADIDAAWNAVREAERPMIHTFISTSALHMEHKLRMKPEDVLKAAVKAVEHARKHTGVVEFSAEDATRSEPEFLVKVFTGAIQAGATTLNVPDTVGYTTPREYHALIDRLMNEVPGIDKVTVSVHCHNDLGLAVANSIAAIRAGARQIECTINGIGERAGNAAMEEIVMILHTRHNEFPFTCGVRPELIYPTSRLLSNITGMVVQANKAIVGANAFAHESGIHQDGVLKNVMTYEIMTPESIGLNKNKLVLGKHSGRAAFRDRLRTLGYELNDIETNEAFLRFKQLADVKKEVYDEDLEVIISERIMKIPERFHLVSLQAASGTGTAPVASVRMRVDGEERLDSAHGNGPVDAAINAIRKITGSQGQLVQYVVQAISGGTDAQGEVAVGVEESGETVLGQGADPDIIVASARAYINALNKLEVRKAMPRVRAQASGYQQMSGI